MKSSWLAGILSFIFPGLGHLYVKSFILAIVLAVANVAALLVLPAGVNVLVVLLIWVVAIVDSVRKAKVPINGVS